MIESYGLSDRGCVRQENQDRILMDHSLYLFAVADGMGGHRHGELAADLAISTLRYSMTSSEDRLDVTWPFGYKFELSIDGNRLNTAVQLANRLVWRRAEDDPRVKGMGTTIAALTLRNRNAVIANVGDSRVYSFRSQTLRQLTFDDTFVNVMIAASGTGYQPDHPMRNVLLQAAGSKETLDEVHVREEPLQSDDLFLISSDGLHGTVDEGEICSVLNTEDSLERKCLRLVEAAQRTGAPDNVSCVLVSYSS